MKFDKEVVMRNLVKEVGREIYGDTGEEWGELFSGESEKIGFSNSGENWSLSVWLSVNRALRILGPKRVKLVNILGPR